MENEIEQKTFDCPCLPELKFTFPLFPGWKFGIMETTKGMKNNQCHMVLLLPQAEAIRDEMGKRLIIAVFKTDNPTPFVAGQDPMQKTTKQHIAYSLYQNNELQLHINSKETIIIHIHDFLTFSGAEGRSMGYNVPTKEHGFDYALFWKEVIESLEYTGQ